jgi:hypothetical protein
MLLTTKIQNLITNKNTYYESRLTSFVKELTTKGMVNAHNFIVIDILYYLLEQGFTQNYINLELYKKLNQLINVTEFIELTNETVVSTTTTPTLTVTPITLTFGSIEVGEESVSQLVSISGLNLTDIIVVTFPAVFQVSFNPTLFYANSKILIPKESIVNTTTLYVKFVPLAASSYSSNITIVSTGATSKTIACTGTGTITP